MKKILLLTTHLNIGGVGIYTVELAKYLKRGRMDVLVMSSGGELCSRLNEEGIEHVTLDIRTKSEFGIKVWRSIPFLIHAAARHGVDLIHAQTRVTQVMGRVAGKVLGIPYVATCHGFFNHKRLARRLFPCWGDRTIAISRSVRDHLAGDLGVDASRIDTVYNGIDLSAYKDRPAEKDARLMEELALDARVPVVGALGRLSPVKGYDVLIRAVSDVLSTGTDCRLLLVGEGREKDRLRAQAERAGISEKLIITPGGAELKRYFSVMDVFCMPSRHEGLGLSLMEAMAAARPCIASRIGGLAELISDGETGLLVPPVDPGSLAGAVKRLIADPDLARDMGEKACRKAHEEFSIEDSVRRTIGVYNKVLTGR
jgi:glycosyltransferase involved in cell wall biosynthesis